MKRVRMLAVLGGIAVALPVGLLPAVALADDAPNQVTIQPEAEYIRAGSVINVGLNVRCTGGGGSGEVVVNVTQSPPETPAPVAAGSGPSPFGVVCDRQTHPVAVTVTGTGFNAGDAFAMADLMVGTQTATDQRTIDPVVVH